MAQAAKEKTSELAQTTREKTANVADSPAVTDTMITAKVKADMAADKTAKAMDVLGNREARIWIHMVKAMVPERVCQIIDQAIQMHGALGVSQHTPLARMYANTRTLRIADGPDEVHHMVVGRNELQQYREAPDDDKGASAAVFRN